MGKVTDLVKQAANAEAKHQAKIAKQPVVRFKGGLKAAAAKRLLADPRLTDQQILADIRATAAFVLSGKKTNPLVNIRKARDIINDNPTARFIIPADRAW